MRRIDSRRSASIGRVGLLTGLDRSLEQVAEVPGEALDDRCRVQHADLAGGGRDRPGVADLAAALGIERGPVQEDLYQLSAGGRLLAVDVGE